MGPAGSDGQPYNGPIGPDGQPYNGSVPPQQGTKFGVKQIITAVVVVAVLGVGAFFVWQNIQKEAALAVGNCLVFTGTPEDADHELVDCDDESVYSEYVGEVIEGDGECSDPLSGSYSIMVEDSEVTKVTCLIPHLAEGQCYLASPEDSVNELESVDCASGHDLEVVSVLEESEAQCDEGLNPVSFTTPARTYCLVPSE